MGIKVTITVLCLGILIAYQLVDQFDPETVRDKNVVITGGSTGIGEQLAYHYARLGANALITARREKQLKKVVEKCKEIGHKHGKFSYIPLDMIDQDSPLKLIKYAEKELGGIDYIVLNHLLSYDFGEWLGTEQNFTALEKAFAVNFNAYVRIASHAIPLLEKSKGSVYSELLHQSMTQGVMNNSFLFSQGFFGSLREEFIMKKKDISVTICSIGYIGTENVVKALEEFRPEMINKFEMEDTSESALKIIKGAAQKWNHVKFQKIDSFFTDLYNIFPDTLSFVFRYPWY